MREALKLMVELVSDLVFPDSKAGLVTGKGAGDHELEADVGYQFGFQSRPLDGARGIVIKADGRGNMAVLFAFRDTQYEMSLEKGEVGIQNAFNARMLFDKNGRIIMNGGTKGVARLDDTTTNGTIEILGGTGLSFTGIKYIAPDGTVTTINATGIQATIKGKIDAASGTVRAG